MAVAVLNDLENSEGVLGAGPLHVFSQAVNFALIFIHSVGIGEVGLSPIQIEVIVLLPFVSVS